MFRIEDPAGRNPLVDQSSLVWGWMRLGFAIGCFFALTALIVFDWAGNGIFQDGIRPTSVHPPAVINGDPDVGLGPDIVPIRHRDSSALPGRLKPGY